MAFQLKQHTHHLQRPPSKQCGSFAWNDMSHGISHVVGMLISADTSSSTRLRSYEPAFPSRRPGSAEIFCKPQCRVAMTGVCSRNKRSILVAWYAASTCDRIGGQDSSDGEILTQNLAEMTGASFLPM